MKGNAQDLSKSLFFFPPFFSFFFLLFLQGALRSGIMIVTDATPGQAEALLQLAEGTSMVLDTAAAAEPEPPAPFDFDDTIDE